MLLKSSTAPLILNFLYLSLKSSVEALVTALLAFAQAINTLSLLSLSSVGVVSKVPSSSTATGVLQVVPFPTE